MRQDRRGKVENLAGLAQPAWRCHQGGRYDHCRQSTARNTTPERNVSKLAVLKMAQVRKAHGGVSENGQPMSLDLLWDWRVMLNVNDLATRIWIDVSMLRYQVRSQRYSYRYREILQCFFPFTFGWKRKRGLSVCTLHLWFCSRGL